MQPFRHLTPLLLCLALSFSAAFAAPPVTPAPLAKDKCPVCGMFVAKYTNWVVSLTFRDSTSVFFDGPKDMFTYYLNMKKYSPSRKVADVVSITVRDYYDLKPLDGKKAFFVIGSDVYGPMGKEIIPFRKESAAREFLKDHKGKKIIVFGSVTPELLKAME
ncbi:MAG: nitrous oxide reductase accessory protein NosL [Verrucomicrobia bacterium]|nr:nitrous oxide reductase accessory protein NosL [Deltaproteobacteria bacterium]